MGIHIGIILDGNGRWATERGKVRTAGHLEAVETVKKLVRECPDLGITTLSLYAFAIKNWKREKAEVDFLWNHLFTKFFGEGMDEMIANGVKIKCLGDRSGIPAAALKKIEEAEEKSISNTNLLLQIAVNYDGVDEIVRAVRKMAAEVKEGELNPINITADSIEKHLDTAGASEPDIIIRTGVDQNKGETDTHLWRGSSFLQFQSAQTYGIALTTRFPDMTAEHIKEAIRVADLDARLFGGQRK